MFSKLTVLILTVLMINCTAVLADSQGSLFVDTHECKVKNMSMMLQESLYEIQQHTSKVKFRVDSPVGDIWVSFDDFYGRFSMDRNGMHYDPAIVDIQADSLETDASFIGMLLKSESFLNVEKFPSMRFVGSNLEWYSDTRAILKGYMTLHDVTQPVAFYVELINADESCLPERVTVKATTTIKRSEFGIHTLLPIVGDDVNLFLSIDGVKIDQAASMVSELRN